MSPNLANRRENIDLTRWRTVRECGRICRLSGYSGDGLIDATRAGTYHQELTIQSLVVQVSSRIKQADRHLVKRIVRNIVLNTEDDQ